MEPERVLGFEDQSRAAAEAERDERIGKVQKTDIEEAVLSVVCKYTHWGARQVAQKVGVTPAFVQQVKMKYAKEIERRCGIKVRRPIVNFESTEETVVEKDGTEKRVVKQEQMPNGMVHVFTEKVEDAPHQSPAATASPRSGEAKGEDVPHQSAAPTASPLGSQEGNAKLPESEEEAEATGFVLVDDETDTMKMAENVVNHDTEQKPKITYQDILHAVSLLEGVPDNVKRHELICYELNQLYTRKNADYGDSFHQLFEEEGIAASRIRLGDKLNRFKRLSRNYERNVKDESIRDTLIDMANYAIMTVMELDANGGN